MIRARNAVGALALLMAVASVPMTAHADRHDINTPYTGSRPFQLDFHGGLAWHGFGFAGGARFGIPIVQNGFVSSLDNAVYINFGADVYFIDDWGCGGGCDGRAYRFAMGFPITLHWEFYFNDTWSVFGELGVQIFLPPSLFHRGFVDYDGWIGQWIIGAVGGSLHLGDVVALTLRVGNPYIAFGITLNLG
jgi:hypothetical protein